MNDKWVPQRSVALLLAAALLTLPNAQTASAAARTETAILAGGCFWGVEGVFEHVKGVRNVVSGYAGGVRKGVGGKPGDRQGIAEAIRITYDPGEISYQQLLEIFATVAHDPTQVNRQGPDVGPRYRSAIFPQNAEQREASRRFLAQLQASRRFAKPVATRIENGSFSLAEPEHQDFMRRNPKSRYVIVHDLPKLAALRRSYPSLWRD